MDEAAWEGAGRRKIHKSEDLPKPERNLERRQIPKLITISLGIFLSRAKKVLYIIARENEYGQCTFHSDHSGKLPGLPPL
jgi:hypothetical protein